MKNGIITVTLSALAASVGIAIGYTTAQSEAVPQTDEVTQLREIIRVDEATIVKLQQSNAILQELVEYQDKMIGECKVILDTISSSDVCVQELESMANGNSSIESVPVPYNSSTPRSRM